MISFLARNKTQYHEMISAKNPIQMSKSSYKEKKIALAFKQKKTNKQNFKIIFPALSVVFIYSKYKKKVYHLLYPCVPEIKSEKKTLGRKKNYIFL